MNKKRSKVANFDNEGLLKSKLVSQNPRIRYQCQSCPKLVSKIYRDQGGVYKCETCQYDA